jgi:hypothetical protein
MSEGKFDVVLQFGQLDMSTGFASKYLDNEHYGVEIIKHNVTPEEAQRYLEFHKWEHIDEKMRENSHVKDFYATCFWSLAQED